MREVKDFIEKKEAYVLKETRKGYYFNKVKIEFIMNEKYVRTYNPRSFFTARTYTECNENYLKEVAGDSLLFLDKKDLLEFLDSKC